MNVDTNFVLIGLVAGWLAGQIVKGGGFGLIGDIVVGILGAFIGGYVLRAAGISLGSGLIGDIASATLGAIVLIVVVRLVKRA